MDSARAKSIILILLVVFNLFLFSRVVADNGSQSVSKETIANMSKILDSRNVSLAIKLTRYRSNTPKLEFGNGGLDSEFKGSLVKKLLDEPIVKKVDSDSNAVYESGDRKITFNGDISFTYLNGSPKETVDTVHISETEKYVKEFLKKYGLYKTSYIIDEKPSKQGSEVVFSYIEKYKGYLVFENYLKIKVSAKGVTYLKVRQRNIIKLGKVVDILAAYQILLDNFKGNDKVEITAVDIGYMISADYEQNKLQSSEQPPVWRVKIKGADKPRCFQASDGKEISVPD